MSTRQEVCCVVLVYFAVFCGWLWEATRADRAQPPTRRLPHPGKGMSGIHE